MKTTVKKSYFKNKELTKLKTKSNETKKNSILSFRTSSTVLTNLQRGNVKTLQNVSQFSDRTIYELAAQGELTRQQIENNLDKLNKPDDDGYTLLIWAVNYGQLSTSKLLIECGADVNFKGKHGETALMFAAANGHIYVIKLLLEHKSNVNFCDEDGNTALIYASFNNHDMCVKELLKKNADFTIQNMNLDTAYNIALKNKSYQSKVVIEKYILSLL